MIRALVVADSGAVMAALTELLWDMPGVEISAFASGRSDVGDLVAAADPDVVLVDEMTWFGLAVQRISEVHAAQPARAIVGLASRADAEWVLAGLRAGARAVVPRDLNPATLSLVLRDAVTASSSPAEPELLRSAA